MSAPFNTNDNGNGAPPTPSAPPVSPMYVDYTNDSPFMDQNVRDEALARRLQEEENRLMGFRANKDQVVPETARAKAIDIVNEEYSRHLAQELEDEQMAYNLQQREQQRLRDHDSQLRRQSSTATTATTTAAAAANLDMVNEEYAMQLAQELEDEEIAYGLQRREQERLDLAQSRQSQLQERMDARKNWTRRRIFNVFILIAIIASAFLVFAFFGSTLWRKSELDTNLPPYFSNDWGGTHSTTDFSRWRNGGKGLSLTIQNALTDDWDIYFVRAVSDWNDGSPKALDITTAKASAPDPACSPIRGIMKVCNNFYGGTGWTGLNEVYYDDKGYITYSVAKMNETYLKKAKPEEKQYVMCHEQGHGFGLPHRDVNINNADLGTCLDYTHSPEANQHPDSVDFENLASLYGTVPSGDRKLLLRTHNTVKGDKINSYHMKSSNKNSSNDQQINIIQHPNNPFRDGRLLHQTKNGAVFERDADNGGRIVSYVVFSKTV